MPLTLVSSPQLSDGYSDGFQFVKNKASTAKKQEDERQEFCEMRFNLRDGHESVSCHYATPNSTLRIQRSQKISVYEKAVFLE